MYVSFLVRFIQPVETIILSMSLLTDIKQRVQRTVWPYGTVARILKGHLKGYKFLISENSGWSPILGGYEPTSHEIFARVIKPGQIVFDLGANNGLHSLLFSKLTGTPGKVFAFEPLPDNIAEIEKNSKLNGISNIHVVAAAVSDQAGEAVFYLGHSNKQGSIKGIGNQTGQKINVKLITLRTFIEEKQIVPDFLKIDIEGAESKALLGFGDLINKINPVFFIEMHTPEQDKQVGEILHTHHYTMYRVTEKWADNELGIPFLKKIKDLKLGYPHEDGIWGTILALPGKKS